jgi:hypothetical protein
VLLLLPDETDTDTERERFLCFCRESCCGEIVEEGPDLEWLTTIASRGVSEGQENRLHLLVEAAEHVISKDISGKEELILEYTIVQS